MVVNVPMELVAVFVAQQNRVVADQRHDAVATPDKLHGGVNALLQRLLGASDGVLRVAVVLCVGQEVVKTVTCLIVNTRLVIFYQDFGWLPLPKHCVLNQTLEHAG